MVSVVVEFDGGNSVVVDSDGIGYGVDEFVGMSSVVIEWVELNRVAVVRGETVDVELAGINSVEVGEGESVIVVLVDVVVESGEPELTVEDSASVVSVKFELIVDTEFTPRVV